MGSLRKDMRLKALFLTLLLVFLSFFCSLFLEHCKHNVSRKIKAVKYLFIPHSKKWKLVQSETPNDCMIYYQVHVILLQYLLAVKRKNNFKKQSNTAVDLGGKVEAESDDWRCPGVQNLLASCACICMYREPGRWGYFGQSCIGKRLSSVRMELTSESNSREGGAFNAKV